jgi:filamentous hemagglutinin family protein
MIRTRPALPLRLALLALTTALCTPLADAQTVSPTALPTGASLASGHVVIGPSLTITNAKGQASTALTITQESQKAIVNWQGFDVGANATVNINQQHSTDILLNRVLSATPSAINGTLNANGKVYLINPAGIVFGAGSNVTVGGIVASTMDISDSDFLAGNNRFVRGNSTGSITNAGTITATPGGMVALLAPELRNDGVISAQLGTVALASGDAVTLDMSGGGKVAVSVDPATVKTMIDNRSLIAAEDGQVILSAKAADTLLGATINNSGVIEATSLTAKGGMIQLGGADTVINSGTLDASGKTGGTVTVTGDKILLDNGSRLNARGTDGGGEIDVGGSWEGLDPSIPNATAVVVARNAVLDASATDNGNGGTVVVRSDVANPNSVTRAYGTFLANGGAQGGNGGRIETSGHWLDTAGALGSASAAYGKAGEWLYDPFSVTITGSSSAQGSFTSGTVGLQTDPSIWTPSGSSSNILNTDIENKLEGGTSVTITTGSGGGTLYDINVNSPILKNSGSTDVTLTLQASNTINLNAAINDSSSPGNTGKLNVNLLADSDHDGTGIIILQNDITTGGGYLHFGDGTTATVNGVAGTLVGGDVYVTSPSARSINTGGGDVTVNGQMILADTGGLTINSGGGNVTFASLLDSGDTYAFVSTGAITWDAARIAAQGATGGAGAVGDTYLATITSRLENSVAAYTAGYVNPSWLGGERVLGIGTNGLWRWVVGPEGTQDSGYGLGFLSENFTGGGGTSYNGAYNNWNGGEPNNSGGANTDVAGESVLQFTGTQGQWNDLSTTNTTPTGYVRETNLANSPLTINAGSGTVTFSGAVGSNKALGSLNVTAASPGVIAINGGSVATSGDQVYSGNVTLGAAATSLTASAGNIDLLGASKTVTAAHSGASTFSAEASGNVSLGAGSSINSDGTHALGVTLTSDSGTLGFGSGARISTNGGDITLVADAITSSGTAASLQAGTGALTVRPHTPGTTLGIGTGAAGTANFATGLFTVNDTFAHATIGAANTGLVTVGGTLTFPNDTTLLSGANIVLASDADIEAETHALTLTPGSGATVSEHLASVLNAESLLLNGTNATYILNNGFNTVSTLAANTAAVNYVNTGSLTVGTVGGVDGVSTTGDTTVATSGSATDLTLNKVVTSTGGNIVLRAVRNFINTMASNTGIVASGSGKHYEVYATDPTTTTEAMTDYAKHYNQTYSAGSTPSYASSGNWFFYSIAPTLVVDPTAASITYGAADPTISPTYTSGFIDGDNAGTSGITRAADFTVAAYAASGAGKRPAGTYALTVADVAGLASSLGYAFSAGTSHPLLTVHPQDITLASFTAANKTYDATAAATVTGVTFTSLLSGDAVGLTDTPTFDDRHVGSGKTVTANNLGLAGADSADYHLTTASATTAADITPATLTYRATPISNFFGQPIPEFGGNVTGFFAGDTLVNATTGTLAWNTPATVASLQGRYPITGSGLAAGDYVFAQQLGNDTALTIATQPVVLVHPVSPALPVEQKSTIVAVDTNAISLPANSIGSDDSGISGATGNSASSGAIAGGTASTTATSHEMGRNITVSVIPPTAAAPVSVLVKLNSDNSFSFTIPRPAIVAVVGSNAARTDSSTATLPDGSALPSWLHYNRKDRTFSAANVPAGGLPLTVQVIFTGNGQTPATLAVTITQ